MSDEEKNALWSTATISLIEEVDKKVLVQLRDGRKLIGTFRSFDQFGTRLV